MADRESLVLETMGCILQILHTRKVWKRRSKIPVLVENVWSAIVSIEDDIFNEALRRLIEGEEYPVEYADRKRTSIWITNRQEGLEKLKEIRDELYS